MTALARLQPAHLISRAGRSVSGHWNRLLAAGMVLTAVFAPPPQAGAVLLTLLVWFIPARLTRERWPLAISLLVVVTPALVWGELLGPLAASVWAVLGLPTVDAVLRERPKPPVPPLLGWRLTPTFRRVALAVGGFGTLGLVAWQPGLMATAGILAAYLLGVVARAASRLLAPGAVVCSCPTAHVQAGATAEIVTRVQLSHRDSHILLVAPTNDWASVSPATFTAHAVETTLSVSPPLSGPHDLQLLCVATDHRGMVYVGAQAEALRLVVVPRAQVAEHLARRFLEGQAPAAALERLPTRWAERHTSRAEFWGTRPYTPGDRATDLDWKHTSKLHELIVKQFVGGPSARVGVLVDLEAEGPEGRDLLAWDMMTLVLTLAMESIPATLVAYDHEAAFLVSEERDEPKVLVRKALGLLPRMATLSPATRVLEPRDVTWLRKVAKAFPPDVDHWGTLGTLMRIQSENLAGWTQRPVGRAAAKVLHLVSPPASVVMLTRSAAWEDALLATATDLRTRGYAVLVSAPNEGPPQPTAVPSLTAY